MENYSSFLFTRRFNDTQKFKLAMSLLDKVIYNEDILSNPQLAAEAWFSAVIYKPLSKYLDCLQQLKLAIRLGGKSYGWDFSLHIKNAEKLQHPDLEWLKKLINVLNGKDTTGILKDWKRWLLLKTDEYVTTTKLSEDDELFIKNPCFHRNSFSEIKTEKNFVLQSPDNSFEFDDIPMPFDTDISFNLDLENDPSLCEDNPPINSPSQNEKKKQNKDLKRKSFEEIERTDGIKRRKLSSTKRVPFSENNTIDNKMKTPTIDNTKKQVTPLKRQPDKETKVTPTNYSNSIFQAYLSTSKLRKK